jgi:hypothetical protein
MKEPGEDISPGLGTHYAGGCRAPNLEEHVSDRLDVVGNFAHVDVAR